MVIRFFEAIVKPEKTRDLENCVDREVTQILSGQRGFEGVVVLHDHREPRLVRILSFWRDLEDERNYAGNTYSKVYPLLKPLLDTEPQVRTFSFACKGWRYTPVKCGGYESTPLQRTHNCQSESTQTPSEPETMHR